MKPTEQESTEKEKEKEKRQKTEECRATGVHVTVSPATAPVVPRTKKGFNVTLHISHQTR